MMSAATNRNNSVHPCLAACTLKTSSNQRHEAVNPQSLAPMKRTKTNAKRTIEEELENRLAESRLWIDELAPAFTLGSCKEVDSADSKNYRLLLRMGPELKRKKYSLPHVFSALYFELCA